MKITTPYKFYMTQSDKDQMIQHLKDIEDEYFFLKGKKGFDEDEHFFDGLRTQMKRVLDNVIVVSNVVITVEDDLTK